MKKEQFFDELLGADEVTIDLKQTLVLRTQHDTLEKVIDDFMPKEEQAYFTFEFILPDLFDEDAEYWIEIEQNGEDRFIKVNGNEIVRVHSFTPEGIVKDLQEYFEEEWADREMDIEPR